MLSSARALRPFAYRAPLVASSPCGRVARQYAPKEATQLFAYLTSRRAVVCLVPPAIAALVHSAVHTQLKAFHFGALSVLTAA